MAACAQPDFGRSEAAAATAALLVAAPFVTDEAATNGAKSWRGACVGRGAALQQSILCNR
jgi:hypothetical protein